MERKLNDHEVKELIGVGVDFIIGITVGGLAGYGTNMLLNNSGKVFRNIATGLITMTGAAPWLNTSYFHFQEFEKSRRGNYQEESFDDFEDDFIVTESEDIEKSSSSN